MLANFYIYVLHFLLLHIAVTRSKMIKPTFTPYCSLKAKCQLVCTCEYLTNCSLLPMNTIVRNKIVFHHNLIRRKQTVADPQPAGMTLLQYDMELEEVSKCWAAKCDHKYSSCFKTTRFSETSQVVIQLLLEPEEIPGDSLWTQIFDLWMSHTESVPMEFIASLPGGEKGDTLHTYSQILSDNILFVGCAWSVMNNSLTFVCTYGPRGPMKGESIYKAGAPCSFCPRDYGCDNKKPFQLLCKEGIESSTTMIPMLATTSFTPLHPIISIPVPRRTPPFDFERKPDLNIFSATLSSTSSIFPYSKELQVPLVSTEIELSSSEFLHHSRIPSSKKNVSQLASPSYSRQQSSKHPSISTSFLFPLNDAKDHSSSVQHSLHPSNIQRIYSGHTTKQSLHSSASTQTYTERPVVDSTLPLQPTLSVLSSPSHILTSPRSIPQSVFENKLDKHSFTQAYVPKMLKQGYSSQSRSELSRPTYKNPEFARYVIMESTRQSLQFEDIYADSISSPDSAAARHIDLYPTTQLPLQSLMTKFQTSVSPTYSQKIPSASVIRSSFRTHSVQSKIITHKDDHIELDQPPTASLALHILDISNKTSLKSRKPQTFATTGVGYDRLLPLASSQSKTSSQQSTTVLPISRTFSFTRQPPLVKKKKMKLPTSTTADVSIPTYFFPPVSPLPFSYTQEIIGSTDPDIFRLSTKSRTSEASQFSVSVLAKSFVSQVPSPLIVSRTQSSILASPTEESLPRESTVSRDICSLENPKYSHQARQLQQPTDSTVSPTPGITQHNLGKVLLPADLQKFRLYIEDPEFDDSLQLPPTTEHSLPLGGIPLWFATIDSRELDLAPDSEESRLNFPIPSRSLVTKIPGYQTGRNQKAFRTRRSRRRLYRNAEGRKHETCSALNLFSLVGIYSISMRRRCYY